MPQEQRNRLILWFYLLKDEWLPGQSQRCAAWFRAARAEPRLVWESPQVRIGAQIIGALIAVWIVISLIEGLAPQPPQGAQDRARTANIHVRCANPDCGRQFVINRKLGFNRFPVVCPHCKQKSGQRAVRCFSGVCNRKFVIPLESGGRWHCPDCGADLGEAP